MQRAQPTKQKAALTGTCDRSYSLVKFDRDELLRYDDANGCTRSLQRGSVGDVTILVTDSRFVRYVRCDVSGGLLWSAMSTASSSSSLENGLRSRHAAPAASAEQSSAISSLAVMNTMGSSMCAARMRDCT